MEICFVIALLSVAFAATEFLLCSNFDPTVECTDDPSSPGPAIPDQTEGELVLQARCLSACIAEASVLQ